MTEERRYNSGALQEGHFPTDPSVFFADLFVVLFFFFGGGTEY